MTSRERAQINRENASKSTGPKTEEGKLASRGNAMKHGLTATVLAMPDEDPADIQEQADAWAEALQPASYDEEMLVDQIALGALKLQRFAKVETEIVAEQVRDVESDREVATGEKLMELVKLLRTEPAKAVLRLRQFSAGVGWLCDRWWNLKQAFEEFGCWNNMALIEEAIRISGYDPKRLSLESLHAYDFACQAVAADADMKDDLIHWDFLKRQPNAYWQGCHGDAVYTPEEAQEKIRERISRNLDDLIVRKDILAEAEADSLESAKVRAMVPADTPANRLFLRYMRSTELGFDRALKTLSKLQSDRKKELEKEAKPVKQNEANSGSKSLHPGSCVKLNKTEYEVADVSDGNLILMPKNPVNVSRVMEPELVSGHNSERRIGLIFR